jgi:asparagine synthase (glutamine-hydrolysing)
MCGIAGILHLDAQRPIDARLLKRMNEVQSHRGPDGSGTHIEGGVGLTHRRLSIIDLAGGAQPLFNEDETVAVTFNGEIYNFQPLVAELKSLGHRFRTHSDTEVIVHAWEQWGEKCVERFAGMFAFALWDRNRQMLFLARDRLGKKPLYFAWLGEDTFLFSSELKGILACDEVGREIDPAAVEDYFAYGYIADPKTILRGVRKLRAGHTMCIDRHHKRNWTRCYWELPLEGTLPVDEKVAAEQLVERLGEAVRERLISEVPLGAFLSGGVDSSAVVAMMARVASGPVTTCSIAFSDPRFDESQYAAQVAARYATNHHVDLVESDDFDLVDTLARVYDEPFADSSAIPTYRVCQLARRHVTVALSGDGGDEAFAGYRRHRWHMNEERVRSLLPLSMRRPLFGALGSIYPKLDWAPRVLRAKSTFQALARDSVSAYMHSVSIITDEMRRKLLSRDFVQGLGGYDAVEVLREYAGRASALDPLSLIQYLDFKTYLCGDILTKVDRASMAHSLEVRVPILDHRFLEWVTRLPAGLKLRNQQSKYLLKKSLEPYLPEEVLYRPKMGFAVPLASWFRGPLRERVRAVCTGSRLAGTGFFEPRMLRRLVDEHQSGQSEHSAVLWALIMFDAFLANVLSADTARSELRAAEPVTTARSRSAAVY